MLSKQEMCLAMIAAVKGLTDGGIQNFLRSNDRGAHHAAFKTWSNDHELKGNRPHLFARLLPPLHRRQIDRPNPSPYVISLTVKLLRFLHWCIRIMRDGCHVWYH